MEAATRIPRPRSVHPALYALPAAALSYGLIYGLSALAYYYGVAWDQAYAAGAVSGETEAAAAARTMTGLGLWRFLGLVPWAIMLLQNAGAFLIGRTAGRRWYWGVGPALPMFGVFDSLLWAGGYVAFAAAVAFAGAYTRRLRPSSQQAPPGA